MDKHRASSATEQFIKNQLRAIARQLTGVERRISIVERSSQGKFRSVTDAATVYYDSTGEVRQIVGAQEDGTFTTIDVNAPPLLAPSAPTVEAREGTLTITWDGKIENNSTLWPHDFSHVEVHISTEEDFVTSDLTEIHSFHARAGGSTTQALEPDTEYFIKLIAVNTSGVESLPSVEVSAIVLPFETGAVIYHENEPPAGLGPEDEGALWIDTNDDNRMYYWNGTTWIDIQPTAIDAAVAAAADALNVANEKARVYAQDLPPTGLVAGDSGDIWVDTNDGNAAYRYVHGSSAGIDGLGGSGPWLSLLDESLATIQYVDDQVILSADGKNKITYSVSVPGTTANTAGDTWFRTSGTLIIGQWTGNGGTSWTEVTLDNQVIANLDAGKINAGYLDVANRIQAGSLAIGQVSNLQTSLDAKTKTFAQTSIPTSTAAGDFWVDTDDSNKMYRAFAAGVSTIGGAAWVLINDPTSKATTFAQNGIPTSLAIGDIWIDTDDSNKMYRAASIGADAITAGEWELVTPPISGTKTFAQDAIPISLAIGDLWIDTNDSNKMYVARSVGADAITAGEWELFSDLTTKTKTFAQTSIPTSVAAGDLWVDTDDSNKMYRAFAAGVSTIGASAWVLIVDPTVKTTTFAQTSIPTSTAAGDLWVDTDDSNKLYRAFAAGVNTIGGAAWVLIDDPSSKTTTFAQTSIPVSLAIGDLWIDTDDSNKMYRAASVGADAITAGEWILIANPNAATKTFAQDAIPVSLSIGDLWIDTNDSNKIYVARSVGADAITAGEWELFSDLTAKTKTFAQTSIPTSTAAGDLWVDTDDANKIYRAFAAGVSTIGGAAWVLISDPTLKTTTYAQAAIPTSSAAGDLWIDTDDSNKLYRAFAAGVSTIGGAAWVLVDDPTAKTTTFAQTSIPVALAAGDIWIDTDDANKMYRATVIGSDAITAGEWVLINNPSAATKTFAQDGIPVSLSIGDIWVDTNDSNKMYIARSVGADAITAGEWELFNDLTTKTKTFAQTSIPTAVTAGDLWVDTDDNNKLYRAFAAGVNTIGASAWVLIQDAVGQVAALQTLWGHPADTTFIDGGDIYTTSIKAQSIILADFLNYVHNPIFDVGTVGSTAPEWTAAVKRLSVSGGVPSGAPYATVGHQTGRDNNNQTFFEVTPGDSFYVEWWGATPDSTKNFTVGLEFRLPDKTTTVNWMGVTPKQTPTSTWTYRSGIVVAPATAKWARAWTQIDDTAGFGNWYFTGLKIRKRSGGELIVDGTIQSNHVVTEGLDAGIIKFGTMSGTLIQSESIDTDKLAATAIDGMTITGALYRTAETGARVEINLDGLHQYDDLETLITRIGGDHNVFTGSIDAVDMTVRDGLALFGQGNIFGANSLLTLRTGQGPSSTAPTLNITYKESTVDATLRQAFRITNGYLVDGANQYGTSNFFSDHTLLGAGGTAYNVSSIPVTLSDGSTTGRYSLYGYTRIITDTSAATRAVTYGQYALDGHAVGTYADMYITLWNDSAMNTSGTVAPTPTYHHYVEPFGFNGSSALGRGFGLNASGTVGKSYVTLARLNSNDLRLDCWKFSTDAAPTSISSIAINFSLHRVDPSEVVQGVAYGSSARMGFGGTEEMVWLVNTSHQNIVLALVTGEWVRRPASEWPRMPYGFRTFAHGSVSSNTLDHFGTITWSNNYSDPPMIARKYTSWTWTSAINPFYFNYAWRGHSSKSPEWLTSPAPMASIAAVKRANITVTVPALPPPEGGVGATRDINKDVYGWVLYAGQGTSAPANASMYRQSTSPSGDPTTTQSLDFAASPTLSGANPVTSTQNFPNLSPAKIVSSAASGGVPLLAIDGDGSIIANSIDVARIRAIPTTAGNTAYNAKTESGWYVMDSTASNAPWAITSYLEVRAYSTTYIEQVARTVTTHLQATRTMQAGVWGSWVTDVTEITIANWGNFTNTACRLTRRGNNVTLTLQLSCNANAAANADALVIPAPHTPAGNDVAKYFVGIDGGTGSTVALYLTTNGRIAHVFSRTTGQSTHAVITYVSDGN